MVDAVFPTFLGWPPNFTSVYIYFMFGVKRNTGAENYLSVGLFLVWGVVFFLLGCFFWFYYILFLFKPHFVSSEPVTESTGGRKIKLHSHVLSGVLVLD